MSKVLKLTLRKVYCLILGIPALFFSLTFVANAQYSLGGVQISGVMGIPFATIFSAVRFAGALWASVGIAFFVWGMINYLLSHENAHHKHDAQLKISKGFVLLFSFTVVWALVRFAAGLLFK